ncbi:MAG: DedA family protein [Candidatus Absconditabacterales bacterium]
MEYISGIIDFTLHIDVHLQELFINYGSLLYGILFVIIFVETGLVIMPLLPGDSLLFVTGSLAGSGYLKIELVLILLFTAAVLGDTVNYHIGKCFGKIMMKWKIKGRNIINPNHIEKTKKFFEKHGKKSIVIARFVPIVRTIAPFVAGVSEMPYKSFIAYNIIGAFLWIVPLTLAGYFFGQIPLVKNNFEKVVLGIIFISILPILIEYIKHRYRK